MPEKLLLRSHAQYNAGWQALTLQEAQLQGGPLQLPMTSPQVEGQCPYTYASEPPIPLLIGHWLEWTQRPSLG